MRRERDAFADAGFVSAGARFCAVCGRTCYGLSGQAYPSLSKEPLDDAPPSSHRVSLPSVAKSIIITPSALFHFPALFNALVVGEGVVGELALAPSCNMADMHSNVMMASDKMAHPSSGGQLVLDRRLRKQAMANRLDGDFNNFYTPANDFFYSKSSYQLLDPQRREIRLLRVSRRKSFSEHAKDNPQWAAVLDDATLRYMTSNYQDFGISTPDEPILACELIDKVQLSRTAGTYCAVSYCAGRPSDTSVLIVDGLPFMAFANLEHAIDIALRSWQAKRPGEDLLLWADQICINQLDYGERAHQVAMMRDIYRRCNETFVCLSIPDSQDVLAWVRDCSQGGRPASPAACVEAWVEKELHQFRPDPVQDCDSLNPSDSQSQADYAGRPSMVNAIQAFMECQWWRRCWVFQEFISSPRPVFISHSTSIPWENLDSGLQFLQATPKFTQLVQEKAAEARTRIAVLEKLAKQQREREIAEEEQVQKLIKAEAKRVQKIRVAEWVQAYAAWEKAHASWEMHASAEKHRIDQFFSSASAAHDEYLSSCTQFLRERVKRWNAYLNQLSEFMAKQRSQLEEEKSRTSLLNLPCRIELHNDEKEIQHLDAVLTYWARKPFPERAGPLLYVDDENEFRTGSSMPCGCKDFRNGGGSWYPAGGCKSFRNGGLAGGMSYPRREEKRLECGWSSSRRECSHFQKMVDNFPFFSAPRTPEIMSISIGMTTVNIDFAKTWHPFKHWRCLLFEAHEKQTLSKRPARPNSDKDPRCVQEIFSNRETGRGPESAIPSLSSSSARFVVPTRGIEAWEKRMAHLEIHPGILSIIGVKRERKRHADLKVLLQHSRHCEASDPRDRIYAFIGLVPGAYDITPNYASPNTVVHTLLHTAQRMVEHEQGLGLLRHVFRGRDSLGTLLPSWVPDWISREADDPLWLYISSLLPLASTVDASRGARAKPEFRTCAENPTNLDLKVRGSMIGILDDDEGPVPSSPTLRRWALAEAEAETGTHAVTLSIALLDDEVWVLHGASLPVLLRREGDGQYSFCGEVMLLMAGGDASEVVTGKVASGLHATEEKDVWIV